MRPSLVIPRLRAMCPTLAERVAGAAEFAAAATADDVAVPCAFVIPGGETVAEAEVIAEGYQEVTQRFTVLVCVDNLADERGQEGAETLFDIRDELIAALLNWNPGASYGRVAYDGSDGDPQVDRARIWHGYDFSVATTVSS